jgi:phosphopantetheinyl transferase (holo-ACP synthase)
MSATPALGVDVVDLLRAHRRHGPTPRFVRRVYAEEERRFLGNHPHRPELPWVLWAAKEAAFKAVSLHRGSPPVFAHADFRVELDEAPTVAGPQGGAVRGRVHWHDTRLALGGSLAGERVVAWTVVDPGLATVWRWARLRDERERRGGGEVDALVARHLTPREAAPIRSAASALVRMAVRCEAAEWLRTEEERLEVVCPPGPRGRVPPELHRDGTLLPDVAISVSHHGDWLAWGVGVRGRGAGS